MNVTSRTLLVTRVLAVSAIAPLATLGAQQQPARTEVEAMRAVTKIVAEPASLTIVAGQTVPIKIYAVDAQGNVVADAPMRVGGARNALWVDRNGREVKGLKAGKYEIVASVASRAAGAPAPITLSIPVTVTWPAVSRIEITPEPGRLYTGVTLAHRARAMHADTTERRDAIVRWTSSNPAVATVDRFGNVTALRPGPVTITAEAEGARESVRYAVAANPVTSLEINLAETSLRTGDVIKLQATARHARGAVVADVPITWAYTYTPDDTIAAPGATGIIDQGRFAAEVPGRYTIMASAGNANARKVIDVKPRDARRRINVVGRGNINNVHTSDLWPFTGKDGRDYAIVGTWGGDGWAYMFDITDMANMRKTDSVQIDARSINDVTISPDGRYGVLSREGASNRVNGVVILDLANPAHPKIASRFDQELTGGVHNVFATNDHIFAISNGDRYVIIDVKDIYSPKYAGEYNHPNSRVHDVWVHDGIAYSSEWGTGVVAVDVGNGKYGGTIAKPVLIATYPTTSGATHEVFPYIQKSTGKVYLFLGDEVMSRAGKVWEGTNYFNQMTTKGGIAQTSGGYTHIVDFTDPKNPRNVAKYHQEEFGSHDIVVQDDVLYQAYYDGGLRLVDVSGELLGNLAEQRREIAVFKPYDPEGFTANAPFVMNAMPWKGHVIFTDFNSGLWAAKLEPKEAVRP
jgi:hypothetical protein